MKKVFVQVLSEEMPDSKPIQLLVPEIPKKGDLFRIRKGKELSASYEVAYILFSQGAKKQCAVFVFLKMIIQ